MNFRCAIGSVADAQLPHARRVADALVAAGLRASVDERADTIARKIADAVAQAVPQVAVVGKREAEHDSVTLREREGQQRELPLAEAVAWLRERCRPPL